MNCLIIDDNPKTAFSLGQLLTAIPIVKEVRMADHPYRVRSILANTHIDLLFIRVRLWDFKLVEHVPKMPTLVFLTGGRDMITNKTETGVRYFFQEPFDAKALAQLLAKVVPECEKPEFMFIRYEGRFHKIAFSDIDLIERMRGSYVQFHLKYGNWLIAGHLTGWIQKLPEDKFIRISDTLIVPASELSKITNNEYVFKGRRIKLTYRFAIAARREMERIGDWKL